MFHISRHPPFFFYTCTCVHLSVFRWNNKSLLYFQRSGTSRIFSHTVSWIRLYICFAHPVQVYICGESDSVLFPVDGGRKREENKKQAVLGRSAVFQRPLLVCSLYDTMTGIPREPPHTASIQPQGFMFLYYLFMFHLCHTLGAVSCFLCKLSPVWISLYASWLFCGWDRVCILVITGPSLCCLWIRELKMKNSPPILNSFIGHLGLRHCFDTVAPSEKVLCFLAPSVTTRLTQLTILFQPHLRSVT